MNRTDRMIPLLPAMILCIACALGIWTAASLLTADAASASVEQLSVGEVSIYDEGVYQNPSGLPAGVTYDNASNVLTLENTTIPGGEDYGGIGYAGSTELTIKIIGTVYLNGANNITYYDNGTANTGATVRIVGEGRNSSKLVQKPYGDNKYQYFLIYSGYYEPEEEPIAMDHSYFVLDGLTIESTGGIAADYTDFTVRDCSWTMDGGEAPIRLLTHASAGKLTVINSMIQMKAFKKSEDFKYAIQCRSLTLQGCSLYGGASLSRLQAKITPPSGAFSHNGYAAYRISPSAQQLWYKLSFNGNKGKAASASMWVKGNQAISASGTLPKATRKHYKFAGWYTKASGGTKVTKATKAAKSMTLYAHWKITGKKKKVRLAKTVKASFGGTYRVTYYKNGLIKKITAELETWTFTYDDEMRYKTITLYQKHFKKGKKPLSKVTFNYDTKKAKFAGYYFGSSWSCPFKVNKYNELTYFKSSGLGEVYQFKYNKKGHLISETEKHRGKLYKKVSYKRNSKGLIRSVSRHSKDEGNLKGSFKYSMKNGVPKKYTAHVSSYTDKASYKYSAKTIRDWQKKILMRQQRMLYYINYDWGDSTLAIF